MWFAFVGALVLLAFAWSRWRPDPLVLADRAAKSGDVTLVLRALDPLPPTDWHRVIKRLWDGYHRDTAVHVAKAYARRHRDAPTAHFWLSQFQSLEPEIAAAQLDKDFLGAFYDPGVAACCGSFG